MKTRPNKLIALLLALLLLAGTAPVPAFAAPIQPMTVRVSDARGTAGANVTVKISWEDNPGISSFKAKLTYDSSIVALQQVEYNAELGGQSIQPETMNSPVTLTWVSPFADCTQSDVFATLTFTILDTAEGDEYSPLTLSYDPDDIYNMSETNIDITLVNGGISVLECVPGDINGDGKTNNKDLTRMFQYLANWNVDVNEAALDVNGDEKVNNKDLTRLFQYLADWDVEIFPKPKGGDCTHELTAYPATAPTCTEPGHTAYWQCSKCGLCFSDERGKTVITLASTILPAAGHQEEAVPGTPATYTENGLTDGAKCSVCGVMLVEQQIIPMIVKDSYTIQYMCDMVPSTDSRYYLQNDITDHFHYTVGVEKALPTPQLDKYIFLGWSDESGNLVGGNGKTLPKGTTGDVVLYANWASNRNLAKPVASLSEPTVYEDEEQGLILMKYKIGTVENIPLYTTLNLQCANGLITTVSQTNQTKIGNSNAKSVSEAIANETTKSATWTLSEEWNNSTKVSQTTLDELNIKEEEAERLAKSQGETYNVGSSFSQQLGTSNTSGGSYKLTGNQAHSDVHEEEAGQNFGLSVDVGWESTAGIEIESLLNASNKFSLDIGAEYSNYGKHKDTSTDSWSNTIEESTNHSHAITSEKSWNTEQSYGISNNVSHENSYSKAISMSTSLENGRTVETAAGGGSSSSEDYGVKDSKSSEYGAVVTFDTEDIETHYTSFSSNGNTHGNYRMVMAGSADVYAVVGYDVAKEEYFVYTYTVTNKETEEYLDYSWDGSFTDYETSYLPFEVPFEVNEYVNAKIARSEGLIINPATGVVEEYNPDPSWNDTVIIVPSYYRTRINGQWKSIKVTGLADGLFENNTNIRAVVLSSFIEEIPNRAFAGCSSLEAIYCPGVKRIGDHAFDGCTSLETFTVPYEIISVGEQAFVGVGLLNAYVANQEMARAITESGARNIVLNISSLSEEVGLNFQVGEIDSFKLDGNGKSYTNFSLSSSATKTHLDGITASAAGIGLSISGGTLILDNVSIQSGGPTLIAKNASLNLKINNVCVLSSAAGKVIVCDGLTAARLDNQSYGRLTINGNLLYCGEVSEGSAVTFGTGGKKLITRQEYENYLLGVTRITFDANGGLLLTDQGENVGQHTIELTYGTPIELPTPTRMYYSFDGWFLDTGEQVSTATVFGAGEDTTLFAHWTLDTVIITFDADGGEASYSEKPCTVGEAIGELPTAIRNHFIFGGWYLGDNQITDESQFQKPETVIAKWYAQVYTSGWPEKEGCTITVTRTSSPYGGAYIGVVSNGSSIYYGDTLHVTYAAKTGYTIIEHGPEDILVDGDIVYSSIYAVTSANEVGYNIVCRSSNGTPLSSSIYYSNIGETVTITPQAFTGYDTPNPQTVVWDSATPKTIIFVYEPTTVGTKTVKDNQWWWKSTSTTGIKYTMKVSFSNRTEDSVTAKITWKNTITAGTYYGFYQKFKATVGGVTTGWITLAENSTWASSSSSSRSVTKTATITITDLEPTTTSLKYSVSTSAAGDADHPAAFSGTLKIPAY